VPRITTEIDAYLRDLTEQDEFTGSVLVARDGEILISGGYGMADREEQIPNTENTRYLLTSNTKMFTSMAIQILKTQGKLDVQDRICLHLLSCPETWDEITIHHLLTHTSGIPNYTAFPDFNQTKGEPTTMEEMVDRFRDKPLEISPGEEWVYSNSGIFLLGVIIEQVSGLSYEAFLQEYIFDPLGMADSGYYHNTEILAVGYTGEGDQWFRSVYVDMSVIFSTGAVYSTAVDMYRWDQALYTEKLIPQDLLEQAFTPYEDTPIGGYGYGWLITERHNRPLIRHGGVADGYVSVIERYIDDRVTLILLSNRDTTAMVQIATDIAAMVFDEYGE
jgi:CubicO group peptidase (beta-lactamase class C family)